MTAKKAGMIVLVLFISASVIALWLIWQGPDALPGVSVGARVEITVAAMLLLVTGLAILHATSADQGRGRVAWAIGLLGIGAAITMWYSNSVLKVSPSSARIPIGSVLPLTAGPITLLERIRGERLVEWSSSNESVAVVLPTAKSPASGQIAIVRAVHAGRATIFAVRGRVRSESRLNVDSLGVIPPVCKVDTSHVARSNAGTPSRSGVAAAKSGKGADTAKFREPLSAGLEACVAGSISSPGGQAVVRAKVSLKALNEKGDTVWSEYGLTDPIDGRYEFRIPRDTLSLIRSFLLSVHQQVGEINPIWFLPTQWGLDTASRVLDAGLLRAGVFENGIDIKLQYSPKSSFAIVLLLLPGIIGLSSTVLYYAAYRPETETAWADMKNDERSKVRNYVFFNVTAWGLLLALFALLYAFRGVESIPLMGDRIAVPTIAPTFAYLGVLVYAIYVLAAEYMQAMDAKTPIHSSDRQRLLLSLGNRIVIAPYVAIVAVVAFFNKLDQPMVPFVAFFTGLWIEPVLGTLKEVGDRLVRRSDEPNGTKPQPVPADPVAQVKALLQQQQQALVSGQPVTKVEVESTTGENGKIIPKVVIYVSVAGETAEVRAKRFPSKLEGKLPDGSPVSAPIEVRQAP